MVGRYPETQTQRSRIIATYPRCLNNLFLKNKLNFHFNQYLPSIYQLSKTAKSMSWGLVGFLNWKFTSYKQNKQFIIIPPDSWLYLQWALLTLHNNRAQLMLLADYRRPRFPQCAQSRRPTCSGRRASALTCAILCHCMWLSTKCCPPHRCS